MLTLNKNWQFPEKCDPASATFGVFFAPYVAERKAAKKEEKAQRVQQRLEEFRASRQKRQQIRQSKVLQAQVQNQAAQTGTVGSSGVAGGVAGIQGQAYSNIFSMNTQQSYGKAVNRYLSEASDWRQKAAIYREVRDIGMTIFSGMSGSPTLPQGNSQSNIQ